MQNSEKALDIHKKFIEFKKTNATAKIVSGWLKDMGLMRDSGDPFGASRALVENWSTADKFPRSLIYNTNIALFDAKLSSDLTARIFGEDLWLNQDVSDGSIINAHDYSFLSCQFLFQGSNRVIIDFGGGYGRLANLIGKLDWQVLIVCDAFADAYVAQYLWLRGIAEKHDYTFVEYFEKDAFTTSLVEEQLNRAVPAIIHCPSSVLGELGVGFADLIVFSHVFTELDAKAAEYALKVVSDTLNETGSVYMRDHGWPGSESYVDRDLRLKSFGFLKVYQSPFGCKSETWGGVEIWSRYDAVKHRYVKRYSVLGLRIRRLVNKILRSRPRSLISLVLYRFIKNR